MRTHKRTGIITLAGLTVSAMAAVLTLNDFGELTGALKEDKCEFQFAKSDIEIPDGQYKFTVEAIAPSKATLVKLTHCNQLAQGHIAQSDSSFREISSVSKNTFASSGSYMAVEGHFGTLYVNKTGQYHYLRHSKWVPNTVERFDIVYFDQLGIHKKLAVAIEPDFDTGVKKLISETYDWATRKADIAVVFCDSTRGDSEIVNSDSFFIGTHEDNDIVAGAGNGIIIGNLGSDRLFGGKGSDAFIIATKDMMNQTVDQIMDFSALEGDIIDLRQTLNHSYYKPDASNLSEFVFFEKNGQSTLIYVDPDGDRTEYNKMLAVKVEGFTFLNAKDAYIHGALELI